MVYRLTTIFTAVATGSSSEIVFGINPVNEAIESSVTIEKVFIRQGLNSADVRGIINHCNDHNIPYVYTPNNKLNVITRGNHQGVIAFISPITYVSTDDIINSAYQKGQDPLIIICEGVSDVRNVGAIARSAWCAGAHGMILPTKSSAIINDEAVKASAGTILHLPVSREKSLLKCIEQLKLNGLKIFSSDMHTEKFIDKADFKFPMALIMGSEGEGVSDNLLKVSDEIVKIPMLQEAAESYNVSVAAGIILYEVMRQRK
jgi:23S rRNA (guanosine2251-2'-O)-methyltransferase